MEYNVFSGFDGMSCGQITLSELGYDVKNYYASEIKSHAINATMKHFPNTHQLGDIKVISGDDLPKIDLYIGGSPCQDFSRANAVRLGADGVKSGLFWEYVRLLGEVKEKNPNVKFFLENVIMKKEHEALITEVIGVEPVRINSSLLSPQLRDRLYWTNITDDIKQPDDVNVNLQDILEFGYTERKKSRALLESDSRPLSTPIKMYHRHAKGFNTLIFKDRQHYLDCKSHYDAYFKGFSAKMIDDIVDVINEIDPISVYDGTRYFTKKERCILQGVPTHYCDDMTDNDAACLLGDGWNVQTIKYIFSHLPK